MTKVQDLEVEKKAQQKADEVKRNADSKAHLKVAKSSAIAAQRNPLAEASEEGF